MRRPVRRLRRFALVILLGAGAATLAGYAARGWILERSQLARVVLWLDADPGDLRRFPSRTIATGPGTFAFRPGRDPADYGDLFGPVTLRVGGEEHVVPLETFLEDHLTTSFLVVRHDSLLYERYFQGNTDTTLVTTFSVSKSLVSLAVGLAVDDGVLEGVDEPITRYLPELGERDPRFAAVTLEHLLRMRSGVAFERGKSPWGDEARTYYAPDLRSVALSAKIATPPGRAFLYNLYNPLLIGLALERAGGRSLSELLSERVWRRIGTEADASWSVDSRRHGFEKMESGFNARPRDLARLGRLYLRGGDWDGERVLSQAWVDASLNPIPIEGDRRAYGYFWWMSPSDDGPTVLYAEGRYGQFIALVPEADLIVVRTGLGEGGIGWVSLVRRLAIRASARDTSTSGLVRPM